MRNLKYILFLLIFISFSTLAQNSQSITGKIIDSQTKKPIDFASVALVSKASDQTIKAAQTDAQGGFKFDNVAEGSYLLKVSFVGYTPFTKDNITISAGSTAVNLGTIPLVASKANVLKEVVVEAQRSSLQLGIDRKIFSVDQSLVSQGGSATDLLANVPSVSVDIDGNVNLRGTNNVRIMIDGKPSALGGNITQVLQSLPASSIETIELITNPSAKYDPEGQSGIINIVLKKNKKIGLNGSVALTAGNRDNYNGNASLSYNDGKVNLYSNYSLRYGNRLGGGTSNTTYILNNGFIGNSSDSRRHDFTNSFKLGGDITIKKNTTVGLSGNFQLQDESGYEAINYLYRNIPSLNGSSFRTSDRDGTDNGYDLSFDLTHKFKRKGEQLVGNFSFGQDKEDGLQIYNQNFLNPDGSAKDTLDNRRNDNGEFTNNYNIQLDYTLPFKETQKLEAGYRSSLRYDFESMISDVYNKSSNSFNKDYALSNYFTLENIVHAVYANYQNQLSKNFGFQLGARAEQAYLNTSYRALGSYTSTDGKLDYFRIYPSVYLTQKFSGEQQLQLSYSRRVNRPRGWEVNPFRDISDPNNIRVGNPNLRPEDIHSFELGYAKFWKSVTLTSSVYYRQVNDVVQSIRQQVTGDNAATITQFFNLTNSKATGFELISKIDFSNAFNITANGNLFYNKLSGNEQYNIRSSDGFQYYGSLTGNITFPKNLFAQFNSNYYGPRVSAQGRSSDMFSFDAGIRKDFLKDRRGSLSFNIRDIFNTRRYGFTTETSAFVQDYERRFIGRQASLTFSYRFGRQDLNLRKRPQRDQQQQMPEEENY